jgi:hypothetical protein
MGWLSLLNPLNWVKLLTLLKEFWGVIAKAIDAYKVKREIKRQDDLTQVERDIEHAKTEDDFRDAADKLSNAGK